MPEERTCPIFFVDLAESTLRSSFDLPHEPLRERHLDMFDRSSHVGLSSVLGLDSRVPDPAPLDVRELRAFRVPLVAVPVRGVGWLLSIAVRVLRNRPVSSDRNNRCSQQNSVAISRTAGMEPSGIAS